jgi:catechol 2,3-dioxygenase-like lactoylglutathione lyase family enzyme
MVIELDHAILNVNDLSRSLDFYTSILGLTHEGEDEPFSILRVSSGLMILLAPWGTKGGEHLAFSMSAKEFDDTFQRVVDAKIPYGDRYDSVGNMKAPGTERGARGMGKAIYCFDPNEHLIEIRTYDS